MKKSRRIFSLVLSVILTVMLSAALCGCGIDTSAAAGDISRLSQNSEDEAAGKDAASDSEAEKDAAVDADDVEAFLADIPEWQGFAFCYVNGNKPDFAPEEIWTKTQESLDPLDDLGRCGTANSCIGKDGMPTEPRGDISEVHPTGWHTERYDFVEGEALFNRCHLIAHCLSGDDAVPRNLITGTSYMNRDGMLQFENAIASYVEQSGNHVMYRVTPVFIGDELIARGVHMQAVSVEDGGEGFAFNVYCYNVQPGIDIDYKTGDNKLSEDRTMLEDYQAGKFAMVANTLGVIPSAETIGEEPSGQDGTQPDGQANGNQTGEQTGDPGLANGQGDQQAAEAQVQKYVLNTNTHKFHYPTCNSVNQMKEKNRQNVELTRDEVLARGFEPCGNCHP